jgi:SAM-dependent methyltransferase
LHTQELVLPEEFELPETFDIVICASCGMAYSDTTGESGKLTDHYRADSYMMCNWEDHKPEAHCETELGPPVDVARLRVLVEQLVKLIPGRDVRILDVGCASGTLLALLSRAGFSDIQGIDPSANAVAAAHRLGQRARVGDVDVPLPPELGTFDIIIISHVLEHLGRPREALKNLRRVLRPGGLVYAEVPDAARYAEFLVEPFVDFNHEHVNHFSMAHLSELFRTGGFVLAASGKKTITVVNWPYPVIYGLWRMLEVAPCESVALEFDVDSLSRCLKPYVSGSRELLEKYDVALRAMLRGRRQVAVRCLGYRAWTLLANTILRDLSVVAYIDNASSKQALTVRGIRVTAPTTPLGAGIPIVVLAYHVETAIVDEYAKSDPAREVIRVGRSQPLSKNGAAAIDNDILAGQVC